MGIKNILEILIRGGEGIELSDFCVKRTMKKYVMKVTYLYSIMVRTDDSKEVN